MSHAWSWCMLALCALNVRTMMRMATKPVGTMEGWERPCFFGLAVLHILLAAWIVYWTWLRPAQ